MFVNVYQQHVLQEDMNTSVKPRTDGTGYLNTLQECLDFCPCEVTQQALDNPHTLKVNYDLEKLEACAGHTGDDILPSWCMTSEYAK